MKKETKVDLKLESKKIEDKIVYVPWIIITPPYITLVDKEGYRRVWIKSRKKIFLYYAYKLTGIKWFINQYNK